MFSVHIVWPSFLGSSGEPIIVTQTLPLPWYQNTNHVADGHYSKKKKKSFLDGERLLMTPTTLMFCTGQNGPCSLAYLELTLLGLCKALGLSSEDNSWSSHCPRCCPSEDAHCLEQHTSGLMSLMLLLEILIGPGL